MINNPVLHKELFMRLRLRQMRKPVKVGVIVIVLSILLLFYGTILKILFDSHNGSVGRDAWGLCVGVQYLVVCLLAPAITANCITQEKEQQTWEMLVFSRLEPGEIIFGKLLARLAIMFLLLGLFLPVTVFSWLYALSAGVGNSGYLAPAQFLLTYAVIVLSGVFFATFGLFMSWQVKKTLFAIMLSYTFVIGFLVIGTFLITTALQGQFQESDFHMRCPLMWINPGFLFFYAVSPDNSINSTVYVVFGLLCYLVGILLMLWRMILGFRHFSYDE